MTQGNCVRCGMVSSLSEEYTCLSCYRHILIIDVMRSQLQILFVVEPEPNIYINGRKL